MSDEKIRRFSPFQIALHWAQGGLYVTLLATGGMILLQRLLHGELVAHATLSVVHRAAAVALVVVLGQMLAVMIVARQSRRVAGDLLEFLLLRPRDLLWLLKAPFHAIWPRVTLPPAGRFNAGQKLHGAFVFLATPAFIATGLVMMLAPGALGAWAIHAALFFPAVGFLGLHLFLAIVNPPTRRVLGGIFTGYVPRDYARLHHPRWVGEEAGGHSHSMISRAALVAALVLAAAGLGAGVWAYGPQRLADRAAKWIDHQGADAVLPGGLAASHADDPRAGDCWICHRAFQAVPSSNCLACHEKIQKARSEKAGYHGGLEGDCRRCHVEHRGREADLRPLNAAAFNHAQARYDLRGEHRKVECDRCHLRPGDSPRPHRLAYVGLAFGACGDCHKDPHAGQFLSACATCHDEQGWKGRSLLFAHDREGGFRIDAVHAALACSACHKPQDKVVRYQPLPKTCEGCHSQTAEMLAGRTPWGEAIPDPHLGRANCTHCHNPKTAAPQARDYAGACGHCHNEHYRELYYQWIAALEMRRRQAQAVLRQLQKQHSPQAEEAAAKVRAAEAAGTHNVQLARRLLDEVLSTKPAGVP